MRQVGHHIVGCRKMTIFFLDCQLTSHWANVSKTIYRFCIQPCQLQKGKTATCVNKNMWVAWRWSCNSFISCDSTLCAIISFSRRTLFCNLTIENLDRKMNVLWTNSAQSSVIDTEESRHSQQKNQFVSRLKIYEFLTGECVPTLTDDEVDFWNV